MTTRKFSHWLLYFFFSASESIGSSSLLLPALRCFLGCAAGSDAAGVGAALLPALPIAPPTVVPIGFQ